MTFVGKLEGGGTKGKKVAGFEAERGLKVKMTRAGKVNFVCVWGWIWQGGRALEIAALRR